VVKSLDLDQGSRAWQSCRGAHKFEVVDADLLRTVMVSRGMTTEWIRNHEKCRRAELSDMSKRARSGLCGRESNSASNLRWECLVEAGRIAEEKFWPEEAGGAEGQSALEERK
jgi:hypothetical protein